MKGIISSSKLCRFVGSLYYRMATSRRGDTLQLIYTVSRCFYLRRPPPIQGLIYPILEVGGLGVHLTWELNIRAKIGLDAQWIKGSQIAQIRVDFDWSNLGGQIQSVFFERVHTYLPMLKYEDLISDQTGIRGNGEPQGLYGNFQIFDGLPQGSLGLIHMVGIESPGITISSALAESIVKRLN